MTLVGMVIPERSLRWLGLAATIVYAIFIGWLYARQPQTVAEITGGLTASVGAYHIDEQAFADGMDFFAREQFDASRRAFERADPAAQDARTQFYIAYAYYREGWGRLYHDDQKYALGLKHLDRAVAVAPSARVEVDDPNLGIHGADELRAELIAGMNVDEGDFNPLKVFRQRK